MQDNEIEVNDVSEMAFAIGIFVVLPLVLWAEAVFRAPRWFRILAHILIVLWLLPIAALTLTEVLCGGGWYNGYGNCIGPFDAHFHNRLLWLWLLMPFALAVYIGAVAVRLFESFSRYWPSRKEPTD